MKKRPKPTKTPTRVSPSTAAPLGPTEALLLAWAEKHLLAEERALRRRVGVVRRGQLQDFLLDPLLKGYPMSAAAHAAAVLARTALSHEPVVALFPLELLRAAPGVVLPRASAGLLAFSAEDFQLALRIGVSGGVGRSRVVETADLPDLVQSVGDFTDPSFALDRGIEDVLFRAGFPGARAPIVSVASAILVPSAPAPGPRPDALVAIPEREAPTRVTYPFPERWEAVRRPGSPLNDTTVGDIGSRPWCVLGASTPFGVRTRPLLDLLAETKTLSHAVHVAARVRVGADFVTTARLVAATESLPRLARALALAEGAYRARKAKMGAEAFVFATELVAQMGHLVEEAGGVAPFIEAHWPVAPTLDDISDTAALGCLAVAAFWRAVLRMPDADIGQREAVEEAANALAEGLSVRDVLLDQLGAPAGTPAERLRWAAEDALGIPPEMDTSRPERWYDAAKERTRGGPKEAFRAVAALHATLLHTSQTLIDLRHAMGAAVRTGDPSGWRPEDVPWEGLLSPGRAALAHHLVHRAAADDDAEAALARLERAVRVAPWDEAVASTWNEARFRAGVRTAALLADLQKETSLGAAAEALVVAETLGDRRRARVARRRMLDLAQKDAKSWIVRGRAALSPNGVLGSLADLSAWLAEDPQELPSTEDDRALTALLGDAPEENVTRLRRALSAQRDALSWASLVEESRLEARQTAWVRTPEFPARPSKDAASGIVLCLRTHAERLTGASRRLRVGLTDHANRALAVGEAGESAAATPWLAALGQLGTALRGLHEEDASERLSGFESALGALAEADRALEELLSSTWLSDLTRRLSVAWPYARSLDGPEGAGERLVALLERASHSRSPEARRLVDDDALAFLGALSERPAGKTPPVAAEAAEVEAPADEDGFRPMQVPPGVILRSQRDLGTPMWALQEGLRQVTQYNLARGRRDLKMLRGTRSVDGALWELRHRDGRHPVRVVYRLSESGPVVVAVLIKSDEDDQARAIARIAAW